MRKADKSPLLVFFARNLCAGTTGLRGINTNHSNLSLSGDAVKVMELFKWIQLLLSFPSSRWEIPSGVELCPEWCTHSSVGVGQQIQLPSLLQHQPLHRALAGDTHLTLHAHPGTAGPHLPAGVIRGKLSSFIQDSLRSAGRRLLGILIVLSYLYFPIILQEGVL